MGGGNSRRSRCLPLQVTKSLFKVVYRRQTSQLKQIQQTSQRHMDALLLAVSTVMVIFITKCTLLVEQAEQLQEQSTMTPGHCSC